MSTRIPLAVPDVGDREERAVVQAIRSGWVAPAGPDLLAFEMAVAERTGRRHSVAVSSGTAALHLALLTAGVRAGDVVACSTLTFIATANAIRYTGATPVFVDSDESGAMSAELLEEALRLQTAAGRRIGAVVPVDLYGSIADYGTLGEVARRYRAPIVSDAAESLGSMRSGSPAGSFGTVAAVSFNGNKIVTTSSGGAVVTDSSATAERIRHLATQARLPVAHYEHEEVGFNYRLSNILAALGTAQLERLDEIMSVKRRTRDVYARMCADIPGLSILGRELSEDNCWMTALLVDPEGSGTTASGVASALDEAGIDSRPVFMPMHLQPVFADERAFPRHLSGVAEGMYTRGLVLPSGASLTDEDRDRVVDAVWRAVPRASMRSATV